MENRTAECEHARVHPRSGNNGRMAPEVRCEYGFIEPELLSVVMRLKRGKKRCSLCAAWGPAEDGSSGYGPSALT